MTADAREIFGTKAAAYCLLALLVLFAPLLSRAAGETDNAGAENAPGDARAATVRVYTNPPGARVFVDGVETEHRAPVEVELEPGPRELRFEYEGYIPETVTVTAEEGRTRRVFERLEPTREYGPEERRHGFEGGYLGVGGALFRLVTGDIALGPSDDIEVFLRDEVREASGLALQLRYIAPLGDRAFLLIDTGYQDARLTARNLTFKDTLGNVGDVDLLLYRGNIDFSVGPNFADYLLPYAGGGLHYTALTDADKTGYLGADNQEDFLGYTAKAGLLYNTRYHLCFNLEYQYHWAYDLEDTQLVFLLGWHF